MRRTAVRPEDLARALLNRFHSSGPVNLYDLAERIGLSIREVDSEGFEGALVRVPGKARGIIAVRRTIRELGRKRFTIAHEIGHYILPGHGSSRSVCMPAEVECWTEGVIEQESAANRFASELLLPSALIKPIVQQQTASIRTAKYISDKFQTSLTAAALKCVAASDEACALVISRDGVVRRSKPNKHWKYLIPVNRTLSSDTLAYHLSEELENRENSRLVQASAWTDSCQLRPCMTIEEDSILLPYYNQVLTILTAKEPLC